MLFIDKNMFAETLWLKSSVEPLTLPKIHTDLGIQIFVFFVFKAPLIII